MIYLHKDSPASYLWSLKSFRCAMQVLLLLCNEFLPDKFIFIVVYVMHNTCMRLWDAS